MAIKFLNRTEDKGLVTLNFEGDAKSVAKNASDFFLEKGYKLKSGTADNGVYERGNYVMRILFGAFVAYYKFNLAVTTEGNNVVLRFGKAHSGLSGGAIGMVKLKKEYKKLAEGLENLDSALGVYSA